MVNRRIHALRSSKTHAHTGPAVGFGARDTGVPTWNTDVTRRGCLVWAALAAWPARAAAFALSFVPMASGLWLVPAAEGDGSAADRGQVSNLLLAVDTTEGWLVGSGPSPAFGRALRGALDVRWPGRRWTVVSPWAHPEAVLGVAGLGPVQTVAHAAVAQQMAERCAGCIERLRQRLGSAASDLGISDPVRLPATQLNGPQGQLGPFDWWRAARDARTTTTVWLHRASGITFAPGLLWAGAPDGRDADIAELAAATAALRALPGLPAAARWLGEQGPLQDADAAARTARYWQALLASVGQSLDAGDSGMQPPAALDGVPPALLRDPRHALNWQRAWRQLESRWLQRSLR